MCIYIYIYIIICSVASIAQLRFGVTDRSTPRELATRIVVEVLMFRKDIDVHVYIYIFFIIKADKYAVRLLYDSIVIDSNQ